MPLLSGVALVIGAGSSESHPSYPSTPLSSHSKLNCVGYGKAVTRLLIEHGCLKLILGEADEAELAKVQTEYRSLSRPELKIISKKCDIKVAEDLEEIIEFGVKEFGEINYCANCERLNDIKGRTTEISPEEFNRAGDTWQKGVSGTILLKLE